MYATPPRDTVRNRPTEVNGSALLLVLGVATYVPNCIAHLSRTYRVTIAAPLRGCKIRFGDVSQSPYKRTGKVRAGSARAPFGLLARRLGWALLSVAACAAPIETAPNPWCASVECSRDCAELHLQACDVAQEACRQSVLLGVQCARGVLLREPPHVIIEPSGAEIPDAAAPDATVPDAADQHDAASAAGSAGVVESTMQRADLHYSRAMQLLGMLEEGVAASAATEQELSRSAASIDSDGVQLELTDEGRWRNMARLAHEYVHAVQRERHPDTTQWRDQLLAQGVSSPAFRALVEGEADLYQRLTLAFMQRQSLERADIPGQLRQHKADSLRAIARSRSPGASAWIRVPYRAGAELHWAQFAERGRRGSDELREAFPRDLAAWIRADRMDTPLSVGCTDPPSPPVAAAERTSRTQEGAYLLLALLLQTLPAESAAERDDRWSEAGRWRGDCLEVFAVAVPDGEQETTLLRWTIAVDDAAFAAELRDALREVPWRSDLTRVTGESNTVIISVGQ